MKPVEYFDLKQFIQTESSVHFVPLDNLLSKLDLQNLRDLKEILKDFYEEGKYEGYTYTKEDGYN